MRQLISRIMILLFVACFFYPLYDLLISVSKSESGFAGLPRALAETRLAQNQKSDNAEIEIFTNLGYRPVDYNLKLIDTISGEYIRIAIDSNVVADSFKVYWAQDFFVPLDSFIDITDSFPDLNLYYEDSANLKMGVGNIQFRVTAITGPDTSLLRHSIMLAYDDPETPVMSVTGEEDTLIGSDEGQMVAGNMIIAFKDSVVAEWETSDSADLAMSSFFRSNELMPIGVCRDLNFIPTYIFINDFSTHDSAAIISLAEQLYSDNQDILDEASPNRIFHDCLTVATEDINPTIRNVFKLKDGTDPQGNFQPAGLNVLAYSYYLFITEAFAGHRLARKAAANLSAVTDIWLAILDRGLGKGTLPVPGIANNRIKNPSEFDADADKAVSYDLTTQFDKVEDNAESHGTNVTITGVGDGTTNEIRGTGPDVLILPFKRADDYAKTIAALMYLNDDRVGSKTKNVKVINMSNGEWYNKDLPGGSTGKKFRDVVKAVCASGRIVVAASENASCDITDRLFPDGKRKRMLPGSLAPGPGVKRAVGTDFSTLVAVSASDGTDDDNNLILKPTKNQPEKSGDWCGYGTPISLAAPAQDSKLQEKNGSYVVGYGCSGAAPQVAALFAEMMMLDKALGAPDFNAQQIIEIVELTADATINYAGDTIGRPTKPDKYVGHGRINVWKAILAVANGGIAKWEAVYANEFGALGGVNVKNEAGTKWYGFRIHTNKQNGTAWLKPAAGNAEQIDDSDNNQELKGGTKLRYATAYKGVQRGAGLPWSLPFGYTNVGAGKKRDFLMLFSIERTDLTDGENKFKQMVLKDPKSNWTLKYPKADNVGMDIPAMRDGTLANKGITFDNFIFTMDFIKLKAEGLAGSKKIADGDTFEMYFDLIVTNPDTLRDTIKISFEAFNYDSTYADTLLDTIISIPPDDTLICDSLLITVPYGSAAYDSAFIIATLEPITEDYICRDIFYGPLSTCQGQCGNANNDAAVNVADAVWIINYVFAGGDPPLPVLACGNANNDVSVNVADAVWIINYVFAGSDPPGDCLPGAPAWIDGDCCPFE